MPGTNKWSFPEPADLSMATESDLRASGLGFRSKYIHNSAVEFSNQLEQVQEWESITNAVELREVICSLPGVGPYVGNHMMVMLGHYRHIPSDSTTRNFLGVPANTSSDDASKLISEQFSMWGDSAALAYHFTRHGDSSVIPGE